MNSTLVDRHESLARASRRDNIVLTLASLGSQHAAQLNAAGARLNASIGRIVADQRAAAARGAVRRRALVDVARRHFLDSQYGPPVLCAASSISTTDEVTPPGFQTACLGVHGPVPEWMKRCHDLAGFFDVEMAEVFPTYVMYMRNLHTGMWGDWNFPRPVDLTAMTPVEAWIALQTTPIEKQGQASRPQSDLEHAMAEIDPEAAANLAERPVCALSDIACEMLKDDLETPLTEERAWDIMLVSLLLMHPSFDPASAGVTGMPSWDADPDGRWWRTRSFPMSVWRGRSSNEEILCELACRAARMVNPESMSWSVSPRSAEDLQRFAEELLSGEQLAQVIRQLVKASEGEGTALDVVGQVITRTQLCEIAGAMSTDTFKRIRDHTALTPLPKGTRDIIYTRRHVRMLIEAAIKKADGKQDWITAARRWQEWLDGGVSAEPTK